MEVGVGATSKWISVRSGRYRGVSQGARLRSHGGGTGGRYPGTVHGTGDSPWARTLRPSLDIGYGIAWHNRGPDIAYTGALQADPLPANRRHGWSGSLAMDWHSDALQLTIGRVTLARETYRPQIEGVRATGLADDDKRGFEVSILETISFRRGEYDDFDGEVHF